MADDLADAAAYLIDRLYKVTKGVPVRDLDEAWAAYNSALASRSAIVEEPTPGEATCECCGGPALTWFAPNPLWNLVQGGPDATDDPGGMLCPNCFIRKAEAAGIIPTAWVLDRENLASPQPHTGRAGVTDEMINAALNEKYGEVSIWSQLRVGVRSPFEIMRAALNAALTVEPEAPTHQHVKRGTEYLLIGYGKMQAERWEIVHELPSEPIEKADMAPVAIYRSVDDGSLWVRPREEFEDGRFAALQNASTTP